MKNPNRPSPEAAISCVMCSNKAVTTAAHIPVCQEHWEAYAKEAKDYPTERPVFDAMCQERDRQEQNRQICGMSKAAEPYGDPHYFQGMDPAKFDSEQSVIRVQQHLNDISGQVGVMLQRTIKPFTSTEAKAQERAIRSYVAALADSMHLCVNGYVAAQVAWSILGFSVPHNSSKKRLRRLKHSMTVLTLQTMRIKDV